MSQDYGLTIPIGNISLVGVKSTTAPFLLVVELPTLPGPVKLLKITEFGK